MGIEFTSAQCKGFRQDTKTKQSLVNRQRKRKDIEDLQEFENTLRKILPEMFELEAS